MILVLTGTNPYSFERLISAMDQWSGTTGKEVFVQLGNSPYKPKNCKYSRFLKKEELLNYINDAEFVVSQGGFGSLRDCMKADKKIIAVPRYKVFKECLDDQEQVVKALEEQNLVIGVYDINDLQIAIDKIRTWETSPIRASNITDIINEYLNSL